MKKINIIFLTVCFLIISIVMISCYSPGGLEETGITQEQENTPAGNGTTEDISGEEFNRLLESEDFLKVFNSFYYPDSEIMEVNPVEGDEDLLYIILETADSSGEVENYYRNKKIQSVWSRAVIYEKSAENLEDEFLEEDNKDVPVYKFTYHSNDKNKVVNVLIKGLDENRTRIMILYWNLQ